MTDLNRRFVADLSVRSDGEGRTVSGICVPFDTPSLVSDGGPLYLEEFARGAFARTITERGAGAVKFLVQHDAQALPIGRAADLREDAAGLYGEFRVSRTAKGDEALELIRDGALDGLSIGFKPIAEAKGRSGAVRRTEVKLREVSAVTFPAYDDARIAAVRGILTPEQVRALPDLPLTFAPMSAEMAEAYTRAVAEVESAVREGRTLSGDTMTVLKQVLDLIAGADTALDKAQPVLAELMGVPNPDADDDKAAETGEDDEGDTGDSQPDDSGDGQPRHDLRGYKLRLRDRGGRIVIRTALPIHHTAVDNGPWDGPAAAARVKNGDAAALRMFSAWVDPKGDPKAKSSYKFGHHDVAADGTVGAANLTACSAGIAVLNGGRGGTKIPDSDRRGVYAHLAAHLADGKKKPPPLQ